MKRQCDHAFGRVTLTKAVAGLPAIGIGRYGGFDLNDRASHSICIYRVARIRIAACRRARLAQPPTQRRNKGSVAEDMGFFDFGTIFFLVAAVVIFFQLRNVLGRRTGNERPPFDPYTAARTRDKDAARRRSGKRRLAAQEARRRRPMTRPTRRSTRSPSRAPTSTRACARSRMPIRPSTRRPSPTAPRWPTR